jgi:hypothetical protein
MTEAEYKLALIDADRATTSSYDYKSKVHFNYRAEKYCKIINKDEWNKPWIVEFDVEALRRDKYYPIPKHIKKISVNIGYQGRGIEEYIHQGCMWGVDIFTKLLMEILDGTVGHVE